MILMENMYMKTEMLVVSDIHGALDGAITLLDAIRIHQPDVLLCLGDILYHGPRNDLPASYAPKKVIEIMNGLPLRPIAVRGNCEAEVDQMVLEFPVMADYCALMWESRVIYATHGHVHGETNPPPMGESGLLLCGHTHVPCCNRHETFTYLNPGSTSIPKNGSCHSYAVLEDGKFIWKDLETFESFKETTLW
jgi:putative phosphoesterase